MSAIGEIIYPFGRPERVIERVLITIQPPPTVDDRILYRPHREQSTAPIQYYALKTEPVEIADAEA